MKKVTSIIAAVYFVFISNCILLAQTFNYHRDFKSILNKSSKKKSALNYDKLLARFNNLDTTMTSYEILAMQIGFTKKKDYNPYGNITIERTYINSVSTNEVDTCIKYGVNFIKRQPLNLAVNYALYMAYASKDSQKQATYYKKKYLMLINSILNSGNGDNIPYFVLSPIDGQLLINVYFKGEIGDVKSSGVDKNGNFLDMLEMIKDGKTKPMNFHINHAAEKM